MSLQKFPSELLAYLAGLLDGDGSIMVQIVPRPDYRLIKYQIRGSVVFFQKTSRRHFLLQIQNELKKGVLRDRNDGMSELSFVGTPSVSWILQLLAPFLRIKLKQCNLVLKIIEQLPRTKNSHGNFLALCEIVDQVQNLNDSKNRKYTSQNVRESFRDFMVSEDKKVPVETFK